MTVLTAHKVSWRREGYSRFLEPETWVLSDQPRGGNVFAKAERYVHGWLAWRTGESAKFWPDDEIEDVMARLQRFVEKNPGARPMN